MTGESAMRSGRRLAESLMRLSCRIDRVLEQETDRKTAKVVSRKRLVYAGRCKLTSYEGYEQERDVAGFTATTQRLSIHLPVGSYLPHVGDIITITDDGGLDDRLIGRTYRVAQEAPYRAFATADRIFIDAIAK